MSVDPTGIAPPPNPNPNPQPTTQTPPKGDVALTLADFSTNGVITMSELMIVTMLTCAISQVINDACSGPFQNLISSNQYQQQMDQTAETAVNAAISGAGANADDTTSISITSPLTLPDGSQVSLQDYLTQRPNLVPYFVVSNTVDPSDYTSIVSTLSGNSLTVGQYYGVSTLVTEITEYGDPSQLPQPVPPMPSGYDNPNMPVGPAWVTYANQVAALFTSQNILNNPAFTGQGSYSLTIGSAKQLAADINTSATNFTTALQQLTNTLNNMIQALATFCSSMSQCQKNCLQAS